MLACLPGAAWLEAKTPSRGSEAHVTHLATEPGGTRAAISVAMARVFRASGQEFFIDGAAMGARVRDLRWYLWKTYEFPEYLQRLMRGCHESTGEVLVVDATQEGTRDLTLLLTLSKQNSWNMQLARNDFESAVALGRIHLVRCLLDAGIDVQHWIGDRSGAYVLALACVHRQAQVAALLLEYDADIECRGTDGMTPLLKTCRTGDDSILDLLLRRRANAGAQTGRGVSAVMLASEQGHVEVVRMLLHFRVNVNRRSADNTTPLMYACVNGHARVVGYLLEARAVVNERGHGMTALICAAKASTCSYPYNLKKYGNVRLPAREDRVECAKAAVQKFCSGGSHGQSRSNCTDDGMSE